MTAEASLSLSNPVLSVSAGRGGSNPPALDRVTYQVVDFSRREFRVYNFDPGLIPSDFKPESGNVSYFWSIEYVGAEQPEYVTNESWDILKKASSGFVTSINSVMPKLIVPSAACVDNGINGDSLLEVPTSSGELSGFNWDSTYPDNPRDFFTVGGPAGSRYVSSKSNVASMTMGLTSPATLVAGGSFGIMANIVPVLAGTNPPKWLFSFAFGECVVNMNDGGGLDVKIARNTTKGQLAEAQAKESMPQAKALEKPPFIICCYPVWNGMCVSNGIQDARNVVKVSSQFCAKTPGASPSNPAYQQSGGSGGFKPSNPDDVEIISDDSVTADMGSTLGVLFKNCKFDTAYVPVFFSSSMIIDSYFIAEKDKTGNSELGILPTTYKYDVYPIWTSNGTSYNIGVSVDKHADIDEETEWRRIRTTLYNGNVTTMRHAGEVFGLIIKKTETSQATVRNGSGVFNLSWTGGSPAGPGGQWQQYIKSASVSIGLDNMSGEITVDKYGLAGQDAVPNQSIGGLSMSVTGPPSTVDGMIFNGLGYGVGDSTSSDGGEFRIQLKGLEAKLADIVLINPPFFDGMMLKKALNYLCGYAGVPHTITNDYQLSASQDISAPKFDFKSGTPVADAINTLMEDAGFTWVLQPDGVMNFLQLGEDGLPLQLGQDISGGYPNTMIMSYDSTPDFDDIRNEIVIVGMKKGTDSSRDTDKSDVPIFPIVSVFDQYDTDPEIPWSKGMMQGVSGYTTEQYITEKIYPSIRKLTRMYEFSGTVNIPGNASVRLYDRWGDYVIIGINHSVDLQSKTWTTGLTLASGS